MANNVTVDLGDRSYTIEIGSGLLDRLGTLCGEIELGIACMIVSDDNVDPLYGQRCQESLEQAGFSVGRAVVPAGESSKSHDKVSFLYDRAVEFGLDRRSFIVALGGGVVGDLAGFVAATYLRGIDFVQVPTSLLAMVDSSVGGKTGINLDHGKNLVGAFHQPALVAVDLDTLKTLPKNEFASGLAEVVKYGVIWDAELFDRIETNLDAILENEPALLESIVSDSCRIKGEVVSKDERENGLRAILNFGHTIGHAIEQASGYGKYLHGEAIAAGMNFAARVSMHEKQFPEADCLRLANLFKKIGLPVHAPELSWVDLHSAIAVDKKSVNRTPHFVLADRLGHVIHGCLVEEKVLGEVWNACCQ